MNLYALENSIKQAVILAGGLGTRLSKELNGLPKVLAEINGKPLLIWQLELLAKYKVKNILLLVGHKKEFIIDIINEYDNKLSDIRIIADEYPRGTAGAVLNVFNELDSEFLIMYGDTLLNVNLDRFYIFHRKMEGDATILTHPNDHPYDSDIVDVANDYAIKNIYGYPHPEGMILPNEVSAALYIISKQSLINYQNLVHPIDFGKELFPIMLNDNLRIIAYRSLEYIKDAGTPDRLQKVRSDVLSGKFFRSNLDNKQAAIFFDRDGTLNEDVNHLNNVNQLVLIDGASEALRLVNNSEYRCIVITNQPVISRGELTEDGLKEIHNKLETELGKKRAFIDKIYFCPHHPDSGFDGEVKYLKIKCKCRKPNTGLIEQAINDFNVDPNKSWLIGDSTTDINLANTLGIRSILVQTGKGGLDYKYFADPDYIFPSIVEATEFVINQYPNLIKKLKTLIESYSCQNIFVGGLSRSGKSTFASLLKDVFATSGNTVKILRLDAWLKPLEKRGNTVLDRYDFEKIEPILTKLENRSKLFTLDVPTYNKLTKNPIFLGGAVEINPTDIVIIEGVIALYLAKEFKANSINFLIKVPEEERKKRFEVEYKRRKYTNKEIIELYTLRQNDETNILENISNLPNNLINFIW